MRVARPVILTTDQQELWKVVPVRGAQRHEV